jgi:hypothetical protein
VKLPKPSSLWQQTLAYILPELSQRTSHATYISEDIYFWQLHGVQHLHNFSPINLRMLGREAPSDMDDSARIISADRNQIDESPLIKALSLTSSTTLDYI